MQKSTKKSDTAGETISIHVNINDLNIKETFLEPPGSLIFQIANSNRIWKKSSNGENV